MEWLFPLTLAQLVIRSGSTLRAWSHASSRDTWTVAPGASCGASAANEELGGKSLAEVRDVDKLSSLISKFWLLLKGKGKTYKMYTLVKGFKIRSLRTSEKYHNIMFSFPLFFIPLEEMIAHF